MSDLIARLEELEKVATLGPWFVHANDLIGGWSVMNCDLPPSRADPKEGNYEVGDFMSGTSDSALIVELRNNLHAILRAMKVTKAAEAYVSENPPLFLQLDSEMYYECCHCQSTARSENDVRHRDECPWVALAAAVKGEQG